MSNNVSSIDSLTNKQEGDDEDRKFLRAAAEAIVATSMNSKIDPTILELLKRIQYASNSSSSISDAKTPAAGFDGVSDNNFLNSGLTNPASNPNHFPTFNLSYFDTFNNDSNSSSANNNKINNSNDNHNSNDSNNIGRAGSQWNFQPPSILSGNSPLYNDNNQSISSPSSLVSTPPNSTTAYTPLSTKHGHELQGSITLDSSQDNSEKPFICSDCNLSFRRSSDLRRHQRAHLPILPHICQLCGKGFARKDALKRHSDTLTCKRNREKLLSSGGDLENILTQSKN